MLFRDVSFEDPKANIGFDEILFQLADKHDHPGYIRFWESPVYFIVLGRIGKPEDDVYLERAASDGLPVLHRTSGGGTVVQGPGCLNYTLVLPKASEPVVNDLRASYRWISEKVTRLIQASGVPAEFRPISDMVVAGTEKKFSGNAQRRGKTHILHHGTILYDFNLELISAYLRMPKDVPEYRKARSHMDFVTNIPLYVPLFKGALAASFGVPTAPQPATAEELSALKNYLN